ncbi:S-adenosyl-L-methionine-dependent methyltransferase [Jimgerdemannia flammicorona]|uniref:S-adenosyl-L-methionine-dependent methyltransferase n=1 Tax=Jimgerdemannia flammicorona TaxID=994334 RepID=A0A433D2R7_9FUNG|nr:S-adenosyl-L-methionine-dependent methyltransferase [Jimgerdemannia flammicorona]
MAGKKKGKKERVLLEAIMATEERVAKKLRMEKTEIPSLIQQDPLVAEGAEVLVEMVKEEDKEEEEEEERYTEEEKAAGEQLLKAVADGNLDQAKAAVAASADIMYRDELGRTPLHIAAEHGHLEIITWLFSERHPWNVIDYSDITAGELALQNKHDAVYEALLNEGCRAELILRAISAVLGDDDEPSTDYLQQKLHYDDDRLMDANNDAVMMGWEGPLMAEHAKMMCPQSSLSVLNVGFGLGLIDTELQKLKPQAHVIIEAHPDVYAHMLKLGWDKKEGVSILFGKWQETVPRIEHKFDAIFFDTYGEFYDDLRKFHSTIPNMLSPNGIYSWFNGLGATNQFFHDVYCRISELDLRELGLSTEYVEMATPTADERGVWDGILGTGYLPIAHMSFLD